MAHLCLLGQRFEFNLSLCPIPQSIPSIEQFQNIPKQNRLDGDRDTVAMTTLSPKHVTFADDTSSPSLSAELVTESASICQQENNIHSGKRDSSVFITISEPSTNIKLDVTGATCVDIDNTSCPIDDTSLGTLQKQECALSCMPLTTEECSSPSVLCFEATKLAENDLIKTNQYTNVELVVDENAALSANEILVAMTERDIKLSATSLDSALEISSLTADASVSIQTLHGHTCSSMGAMEDDLSLPYPSDIPPLDSNKNDENQENMDKNLQPGGKTGPTYVKEHLSSSQDISSPRRSIRIIEQCDGKRLAFSSPITFKQTEDTSVSIHRDVNDDNVFISTEHSVVFNLKAKKRSRKFLELGKENTHNNSIRNQQKKELSINEMSENLFHTNSDEPSSSAEVQQIMSEPDLLPIGCNTPISDKTAQNLHSKRRTPRSAIVARRSTRIAEKTAHIK